MKSAIERREVTLRIWHATDAEVVCVRHDLKQGFGESIEALVAQRIYAPQAHGQLERVTSVRPLRCVIAEQDPMPPHKVAAMEYWRVNMDKQFELRSDQVHSIRHGPTVESIRVLEFIPRAAPGVDTARAGAPLRR